MCIVTRTGYTRVLQCSSALDKSMYPFIGSNVQVLAFLVSAALDYFLVMNYLDEVFD